jgi:hypothetical protein
MYLTHAFVKSQFKQELIALEMVFIPQILGE